MSPTISIEEELERCDELVLCFASNVTDIHAVLEVNVLDEDKNKVVEFLGKVEIPIIQVMEPRRNCELCL